MDFLIRKARKVIEDPRRALRYVFRTAWRKFLVHTVYRFRNSCHFFINSTAITFSTRDWYSREWFFPRCDNGRFHEPAVTRLMLDLAPKASSFIDVGAHLGYFTVLMASVMPDKTILALEMDDRAFSFLKENITLNNNRNIISVHAAVTRSGGVVSYRRPKDLDSGESLVPDQSAESGTDVIGTTLDDAWHSAKIIPGIIKIDVEGAEYDVLRGAPKTLEARPLLFLEVHGNKLRQFGSTSKEVIAYLEERSFVVFKIQDHRNSTEPQLLRLSGTDDAFENNIMTLVVPQARLGEVGEIVTMPKH